MSSPHELTPEEEALGYKHTPEELAMLNRRPEEKADLTEEEMKILRSAMQKKYGAGIALAQAERRKQEETKVVPITPDTPTNLEGLTFSEALEKAFWQAGGVSLLSRLAAENPLEFVKICAKLIPVEMKGLDAPTGLTVVINSLEGERVIQSIEGDTE